MTALMSRSYLPGEIRVEQELPVGPNYRRLIVSYVSDDNTIYALMTIPDGARPPGGFPVILFNHGYIPPESYRTTERYVAYQDALARAGYITFKSDYRGHGRSEGEPNGDYEQPVYTIDVLNALASLKQHPEADPNRIGMWGHSLGGHVTLRSLVISDDLRAAVIWAGVVAPYDRLFAEWRSPRTGGMHEALSDWAAAFLAEHGSPSSNPDFWNAISPGNFVSFVDAPVQLHHSPDDVEVPFRFSEYLAGHLSAANKPFDFYSYPGDDHNLSRNFGLAMQRTINFFDQHLK
jgi:dipeptidyl aminopeptidase/acylaminoacyl peptidase